MSIGLKRGTVIVEPYDPRWPVEFEQEKQKLLDVFGDRVAAIEAERTKYEQLKTTLAKKYANDRETYSKLKDDFFQSIFQKAFGPEDPSNRTLTGATSRTKSVQSRTFFYL